MNPPSGATIYEWGSDSSVDSIIAQFPVDTWPEAIQEWFSWALYYTRGFFQPLITSIVICSAIKAESSGDRNKHSGYVNEKGVLEDSVGLFQMYAKGAGRLYVPELNNGIDRRLDPKVQFDVMVPQFRDRFITSWNLGFRGPDLARDVCGHVERPKPEYWVAYATAWNSLVRDLPWKDYLQEGF